nr:MAG TPA: hypothetical protein [Caudoviricetes sp.]
MLPYLFHYLYYTTICSQMQHLCSKIFNKYVPILLCNMSTNKCSIRYNNYNACGNIE